MEPLRVERVRLWPTALLLRRRFRHAAHDRHTSDSVFLRLSGGRSVGWGETLPRSYVTGETVETVCEALRTNWLGPLLASHWCSFESVLAWLWQLPDRDSNGRLITASRALVELAMLDLASRYFGVALADVPRLAEQVCKLPGEPANDNDDSAQRRVSAGSPVGGLALPISAAMDLSDVSRAGRAWRKLAMYRVAGFRQVKVKLGGWSDACERVMRSVAALADRLCMVIRVDANNAWTFDEAVTAAHALGRLGVRVIEEPLRCEAAPKPFIENGQAGLNQFDVVQTSPMQVGGGLGRARVDERWQRLAEAAGCDLLADESLLCREDALRLSVAVAAGWPAPTRRGWLGFNLRISKLGGLLPCLWMARLVRRVGWFQVGCMVGESSLLSAAGRLLLASSPQARFAEGCYGQWLLRRDPCRPRLQVGYGGRVYDGRAAGSLGWGVEPQPHLLDQWSMPSVPGWER